MLSFPWLANAQKAMLTSVKAEISRLLNSANYGIQQLPVRMSVCSWHNNTVTLCLLGGLERSVICYPGVRVNIMIWDEIDSGDDLLTYTRVAKKLHGGGASEFFKDTAVSVKLMPRKSRAPQVSSQMRAQIINNK